MEDKVLGVLEDSRCPVCKSKSVICYLQFPMLVEVNMKGHIIRKNPITGKRMKLSNKWMAQKFKVSVGSEFQVAVYKCQKCDWESEPYVP